jgi:hypothetical protein
MRTLGSLAIIISGVAETWREIFGYEGIYEVSDRQRVRSRYAHSPGDKSCVGVGWRILRQSLDSHGCPQVNLCLRGKPTKFLVAHLVANAFLPTKSSADQVLRHLNDDPTDNRIENLAWGTYHDNAQDSMRNGTFRRGSTHYNAKLNDDKIREIRHLDATGKFSQQELGLRFGVRQCTISAIVRLQSWKHVI